MLPHSGTATFEMMLALRGQLDPTMDPPAAFEAFDRFREEASRATCTRALVSQELLSPARSPLCSRRWTSSRSTSS
jgi:hypothetical protein